LLRSGAATIGGKIQVNPSGGLACFGRPSPPRPSPGVRADLAAQGQAIGRQVEGAEVGITANQGLFGTAHRSLSLIGSSLLTARYFWATIAVFVIGAGLLVWVGRRRTQRQARRLGAFRGGDRSHLRRD
jgi:hypothetical protein